MSSIKAVNISRLRKEFMVCRKAEPCVNFYNFFAHLSTGKSICQFFWSPNDPLFVVFPSINPSVCKMFLFKDHLSHSSSCDLLLLFDVHSRPLSVVWRKLYDPRGRGSYAKVLLIKPHSENKRIISLKVFFHTPRHRSDKRSGIIFSMMLLICKNKPIW